MTLFTPASKAAAGEHDENIDFDQVIDLIGEKLVKVRDIYSVDDNHLLMITTDRLSAYDVILPDPVPGKGKVLTRISLFWFRMMADIVENQLTELSIDDVVDDDALCDLLRDQ